MKSYDADLALAVEAHVNPEDVRRADEAYAVAMERLTVAELIDRMRHGLIDEAYGAAMEMARRENESTTEAGRYFGAQGADTVSCGVCGLPMDRNADAHTVCKRAR